MRAVVLGVHSGLYLIPRIPITLWRVARVLRPNAMGVDDRDLLAFGAHDAGFRPWYAKLAHDQARSGRTGIVWDDGYGLPMGTRFYNNALTYRLYGALSLRRYLALSILAYLAVVGALVGAAGGSAVAVAAVLLVAGSTIFVGSQIHLGKPELLWWFLVPPMLVASWAGEWALAGALFSAIAFVNFTTAFFAGLSLATWVVVAWPPLSGVGWLLAGMAPGLLKTLLRLVPVVRSGFLQSIAREQTDAVGPGASLGARLRLALTARILLHGALYGGAVALLAWRAESPLAIVLFGAGTLAVYVLGQSVVYLADPQTFWMWHLSILVALAAHAPGWAALLALALYLYPHPVLAGAPLRPLPASGAARDRLAALGRRLGTELPAFPFLRPLPRSAAAAVLDAFLAPVPDGSRILFEVHAGERTLGGFRALTQLCDAWLPARDVELVPDGYVRIGSMDFHVRAHARYNESADDRWLQELPPIVGASFVLAYSPALVARLERLGFSRCGTLCDAGLSDDARAILSLPERPLVLLRAPREATRLSPPAPLRVRPNALEWEASAGVEYLVRYAWHPRLRARQGDVDLPVEGVAPVPDVAFEFVRVRAAQDGPLRIEFRRGWL